MKIGLASKEFVNGDIYENTKTIMKTMMENRDLDYIFFPEAFLPGFDGLVFEYETDKYRALPLDGRVMGNFQDYCRNLKQGLGFGYIESVEDKLYSSFVVIGQEGEIIHNFRRLSPGWKEGQADGHYLEGEDLQSFKLGGRTFVSAICGDLWDDEILARFHKLDYDYVLWPNYNSYTLDKWEGGEREEYGQRAKLIGENVFWFNSHNQEGELKAYGGAIYFKKGEVDQELAMGEKGVLKIKL